METRFLGERDQVALVEIEHRVALGWLDGVVDRSDLLADLR